MNKALLLGILGLTALSVILIPVYACFSGFASYPWAETAQWTSQRKFTVLEDSEDEEQPLPNDAQGFTWRFQRILRLKLANRWRRARFLSKLELSEEFKQWVIGIAKDDGDVQDLLESGYNVTCIKPVRINTVVQGDGEVAFKVEEVLLVLVKDKYDRALVEIDLESGKVTKITIINVTVIDKSASTSETTD